MITKKQYELIAEKYGYVCSWAVWEKAKEKPKSEISNMDVFDISKNPQLLNTLRTDVVMVALNFAREVEFEMPFMNFHDANPYGQDYKIRHAFQDSPYWGAYMTDIIKDFPMLNSADVVKHLKKHPEVVREQLEGFRKELEFINSTKPIIIAFGRDTFDILNKGLKDHEYSALVQVTHYSHQINKDKYREEVLSKLSTVT